MDEIDRFYQLDLRKLPLLKACKERHAFDAILMIRKGHNVNESAKDYTPLFFAVSTDCLELVRCLVQKGADINAFNYAGETPLHYACRSGNDAIVDYLLKSGGTPSLNVYCYEFVLPLQYACRYDHVSVVKTLIRYGVDITKGVNERGEISEVTYSRNYGNSEIAVIVREEFLKIKNERSKKHREKILLLCELPIEKVKQIGPAKVCFDKDFMIGRGCDGTSVHVGFCVGDGSEVAVKRILTHNCEYLSREQQILNLESLRRSQYIVNYRHFESDDTFFYLVFDLCEGTLEDYIKSHSEEHLKRHGPTIIREMLCGLEVLHSGEKPVLHMDLKPSNILVDPSGHMRLTDFGISQILSDEQTTVRTGQKGTEGWVAAESLIDEGGQKVRFKKKSDIQVAGMISFYILTKGRHPFGARHERSANIIRGNPVNLDELTDPVAKHFVSWMISHDIDDRPYAEEALTHLYLQQPTTSLKWSC